MTFSTFRRMAFAAGFAVVALTACAGSSFLPDDPLEGRGPALGMVPINHTDRYAVNNCEEVVYPGVHSDVGGGYGPEEQGREQDLSLIPLRHMYAEALRAGVPLQGRVRNFVC
ncbi:hypothetical protein BTRA_1661 [Burkholderia thailandensis USAMRU Malaysia |uniref:phospholipase effector Tle1 domain-containing protein n=4 Tax=Burkholderia thailandensis TaxID=57975 RepID=UPI0003EC9302|nr:hypothetical protein BTQ_2177 [Burkholderia thailandensis 2002721723]AHI77424.1 hypothetical protein BTJ_140 [Burkholderia thailandensis E444]AIC85885.1 hypothetical protein BTRA_1661 [Burkholderia thailandensis USAMRU Malaysia \